MRDWNDIGGKLVPYLHFFQGMIHEWANEKGFWESNNDGEKLALMHSEISEGLEALRCNNPPSDHLEDATLLEEELADLVIRVLDYAEYKGINIAEVMVRKMLFNESRTRKHGKLF